jgi:hypothetical protein
MFRDVSVRQVDIWKHCAYLLRDGPPDDTHLGCIPKASGLALKLLFLMCSMDEIMAGFTKRDEILWTIPAGLPRFDMMHSQDGIFRFPVTPLASVCIAKQHILTHIPEP